MVQRIAGQTLGTEPIADTETPEVQTNPFGIINRQCTALNVVRVFSPATGDVCGWEFTIIAGVAPGDLVSWTQQRIRWTLNTTPYF